MDPTTIDFPQALPVTKTGRTSWRLDCDGVSQKVTNLTKPYFKSEGYTKGDLLAYYYNVAPWILPFLRDRALTLKRMPEGADGAFFYAKNAPDHVPDWVPRASVVSDDNGKTIHYLMAQDTASLMYVANLGCIEMHPWHSRIDALGYPDYAFFDLDPFEVDFRTVKDVALVIKAALDQLGLTGYPRTSGATGMHIYLPLDRVHTFAQVRELVTRICRLVNQADPDRTTMQWQIADRTGKVFLDAGMNTEGRNIAAAYSVRPHRGAPVSTPLQWEELQTDVEPGDFTMATIWNRLDLFGDIFTAVLGGGQTLWSAMEAVGLDVKAARRGPSHSLGRQAAEGVPAGVGPPTNGARVLTHPSGPNPGTPDDSPAGARVLTHPSGPNPGTPPLSSAARTTEPAEPGELSTYRAMRDFGRTAEPAGGTVGAVDQNRFVIQHHLATRLHHDLRLERGGTLRSWALPKGLPMVSGLTHLAVQTEDHPLEYMTFAGDIPDGQYGAGPVRTWDTGSYQPLEWEEGKVTFTLDGHRHAGEWHLFRTDPDNPNQWLITRAKRDTPDLPAEPPVLTPCLATTAATPFDDDDWLFEVKWDGIRAIATVTRPGFGPKGDNNGRTRLVSRNGNDISPAYPELAPLWERILAFNAVLDGEVVALGPDGRPSFGLLQQRMHLRGTDRVDRARKATPVTFVVFDLLAVDGQLLTGQPLTERLSLLADVLVPGPHVTISEPIRGDGTSLFEAARAQGLEGVVAKRASAPYLAGRRSSDWRKIKVRRTAQVVIGGWLESSTGNKELGSLLVGAHDVSGLRYLGRVGTGFDAAERRRLQGLLQPQEDSPFVDTAATASEPVHWVRPTNVAEVTYGEVTDDNRLRAPSYTHSVPDVPPQTVTRDQIG